jgi:uncharacterized protein (DUF934 family)
MRHILRRHELREDDWRYAEEDAAAPAVILRFAALTDAAALRPEESRRIGVRIAPADPVEALAGVLPQLSLVAIEFPGPGDGRGYSQARLLRGRLGFEGELRAVGAGVRQDQLFLMARCGFDAFELADGEDPRAARRALLRYDVAYQPGAPGVQLRRQRFFAR